MLPPRQRLPLRIQAAAALFGTLLFWPSALRANPSVLPIQSPEHWLQQASTALQERNYSGRFSYEYGGALDTLAIAHSVQQGLETERLQHLSGPQREVIRTGRSTGCVNTGSFLLRNSARPQAQPLSSVYQWVWRGQERIAGRNAVRIDLQPLDAQRYGMALALDETSGLPLMWMLIAQQGQVLERMQFIELQLDPLFTQDTFSPSNNQTLQLNGQNSPCNSSQAPPRWAPGWLPKGFVLAQVEHPSEGHEILSYTDGLAAFSLFIKPLPNLNGLRQGMAQRGATLAVMTALVHENRPYSLVLTGEIPPETASLIVQSVQNPKGL